MEKRSYRTLSDGERKYWNELIQQGKTQGYRVKHEQILLKLDEITANKDWPTRRFVKHTGADI